MLIHFEGLELSAAIKITHFYFLVSGI